MPNQPNRDRQAASAGQAWRATDRLLLPATALAMTVRYLIAYRQHPSHPHIGGSRGWWAWFDQSRYYTAATAWSQGNLDPAQHWYLPGYPMIAAPFVKLLSVHAFLLPDLACLLASLWLFTNLAARLARGMPHARAIAAVLFAAVTVVSPLGLETWVVPWSTTGATPLVYGCLLASVCFIEQPSRPWLAFLAGMSCGMVFAFRPTDTLPLAASCATGVLVALLARRRPDWRQAALGALSAGAGLGLAAGLIGFAYWSIYGFEQSGYIIGSGTIGFDWGLVPLHWVTLFLDPQPLLSDGRGLIEAFPWIAAGLAGSAACLLMPPRQANRAAHVAVIAAAVLHTVVYLAYRDLHPGGLFRFWNYHYLKWVYPVLAFYGVLLFHALLTDPRRRLALAGVALATLVLLLPWRAQLRVTGIDSGAAVAGDDRSVAFESGMGSVRDGLMVAATGGWGPMYFGPHDLVIGDRRFYYFIDFRALPRDGGLLLVPLRPLPAGLARLTLHDDVRPDLTVRPAYVRQDIVFGVPCWIAIAVRACERTEIVPPHLLPGGAVTFDGSEQPYLTGGWSVGDAAGRWTDGDVAGIHFRLASPAAAYTLQVEGSAYVPAGAAPLKVQIFAGEHKLVSRQLADGSTVSLTATLTARDLIAAGPDVAASITLRIANPRAPGDFDPTSPDTRRLGLFVRRLSLTRTSAP